MDRNLAIVTTAALLHDIGKFYRRAEKKSDSHQKLSEIVITDIISQGLKAFFSEEEIKKIGKIVRSHHYERDKIKDVSLEVLSVVEGDRLSSGLDRHSITEKYDEKKVSENTPLLSIFEEISMKKNEIKGMEELLSPRKKVYKFEKLSPESAFPITKYKYIDKAQMDYKKLWENFKNEVNSLRPTNNFNFFFESLKSLLIAYTWCIPSSTYSPRGFSIPDIPLCDHLIASSAIAASSFIYKLNNPKGKSKFLLLSGDFSGIQNFIFSRYGESKKNAAKILRAKSLLVSLALWSVIDEIIEQFKLNRSSVFINAGGKFVMILPDIADAEEKIKLIKRKIEKALIENHYGLLSINLAYVKATSDDFEKGRFLKKLQELNIKEGEEKLKAFSLDNYQNFAITGYIDSLKGEQPCSVCGVRPKKSSDDEICELCDYLAEIGQNLPKKNYLIMKYWKDKFPIPKIELKKEVKEEIIKDIAYCIGNENSTFPKLNINTHLPYNDDTELPDWKKKEIIEKCKEEKISSIKTFCQLGIESLYLDKDGETILGKPFIGVLKADVDNLGFIFSKGFAGMEDTEDKAKQSLYSVSRVMYLSRMIDFFFSQVIPNEFEKNFPNIYAVFAGGDDLFLIGSWEDVIKLTKKLKKLFTEYVAENPDITFSAGIFISKPNIPVYQLADGGEEQLEKAKEKKNSVALFNISVSFDELEKLLKIAEEIEFLHSEGKLSTAMIYKILELSNKANEIYKDAKNALWKPYLSYLVYRNYNTKNEREKEEFLAKWIGYIERFSENISKKEKENKLYIAIAKALYRRRKYGKAQTKAQS